jgi:CheY-like chemotaxis protein
MKSPDEIARKSVLLYEPNGRVRNMHAIMLHTNGYKVESTGNEAEAHALCDTMRPDLVLVGMSEQLDLTFQACERFRRRHPRQNVNMSPCDELFLSPLSYDGVVVRAGASSGDFLEHVKTLLSLDAAAVAAM